MLHDKKSLDDMTLEDLQQEHRDSVKKVNGHYVRIKRQMAINKSKGRSREENKKLLDLMTKLYGVP